MNKDVILDKALEYGIGIDLNGYNIENLQTEVDDYISNVFSCETKIKNKDIICSLNNQNIVSVVVDKQGLFFRDIQNKKEATKFVAPLVKFFVNKTFC